MRTVPRHPAEHQPTTGRPRSIFRATGLFASQPHTQPRRIAVRLLLTLTWAAAAASPPVTSTESEPATRLGSALNLYVAGEYLQTIDSLETLFPLLTDEHMEKTAYRYLGLSYAMLRMESSAERIFHAALTKHPDLEIDTLEVPPSIASAYVQAKANRRVELWKARKPPAVVSSIAGIFACGLAGALFFHSAGDSHYSTPYLIAAIASTTAAAALVPMPFYLLIKRDREIQRRGR